jgi:4'-phosphopantetheinyl transferase
MLYLFTGTRYLSDDFIDTCKWFLPEWRLNLMMSFRYPFDRKLSAVAYLVLVYALKSEGLFNALPEFGYNANGKPFLTNYQNVYFNISHCRDAVACYLSDMEVGIDVETVGEYDDELAKAICNDEEYRWIMSSNDLTQRAKKFTLLWTQKESILKWRGTGIDCDPVEIKTGIRPYIQNPDFHLISDYYNLENFCISICKQNH